MEMSFECKEDASVHFLQSLAIYIDWLDIVIPQELVDHFGQYNQGNLHLFTQPNPTQ
jgi:hypothetical protein